MPVHLRVVGRFITGEVAISEESHNQKNNDGNNDRDPKTGALRARRPSMKIIFGGR
jgi:hypothetical protein